MLMSSFDRFHESKKYTAVLKFKSRFLDHEARMEDNGNPFGVLTYKRKKDH